MRRQAVWLLAGFFFFLALYAVFVQLMARSLNLPGKMLSANELIEGAVISVILTTTCFVVVKAGLALKKALTGKAR